MKELVSFFCLTILSAAVASPCLIGESSRPDDSVFAPSDKVQILFRVTGLQPKQAGLSLKVAVSDLSGKVVRTYDEKLLADVGGMDEVRIRYQLPCGAPGFYRVRAELSDGTKLKTAWSDLPDGEMTYCILPNGAAGARPVPAAKAGEMFYTLSKGRPKPTAVKRTAPKEAYFLFQQSSSSVSFSS